MEKRFKGAHNRALRERIKATVIASACGPSNAERIMALAKTDALANTRQLPTTAMHTLERVARDFGWEGGGYKATCECDECKAWREVSNVLAR